MIFAAVFLYLLWITPLKGGVAFHWQEKEQVNTRWGVMIWGLRFGSKIKWPETHAERLLSLQRMYREGKSADRNTPSVPLTAGEKMIRGFYMVLISDKARKLFQKTCRLERMQLEILWGLEDAGKCAVLQTIMKGLCRIINHHPHCFFRSFMQLNAPLHIRGGCIVQIRLGNLLMAAVMGAAAYYKVKRKEEKLWNAIPLKT